MNIKRVFSILLRGVLALSLTACGQRSVNQTQQPSQGQQTAQNQQGDQPSQSDVQSQSEGEQTSGKDGKTLVVYHSASGNTQAVAQTIADTTGGDLFEIVPAEPYSSADLNWRDNNSRVSKEHDDPSLRNVALTADTADNWDNYGDAKRIIQDCSEAVVRARNAMQDSENIVRIGTSPMTPGPLTRTFCSPASAPGWS